MYIQGAGVPGTGLNTEGTETRNDLMLVTISGDAEITASMAIGTNASSGQFAGFTLNIEGGTIRGKNSLETDIDDGCALYLPAVGITNISDGTISGGQAIRICAGELNITGGQIIGTTVGDNSDLIAGGSGGTQALLLLAKLVAVMLATLTSTSLTVPWLPTLQLPKANKQNPPLLSPIKIWAMKPWDTMIWQSLSLWMERQLTEMLSRFPT